MTVNDLICALLKYPRDAQVRAITDTSRSVLISSASQFKLDKDEEVLRLDFSLGLDELNTIK